MSTQTIKFNANYNNKLLCPSLTTIRLRNDSKYVVGNYYDIYFMPDKNTVNILGPARLLDIKHFMLNELSVFMSHIDMGLHPMDGKKLLMAIYEDCKIDWATQQLSYLLLDQQDVGIRTIIPDRIKLTQPEINLFTTIPYGYEPVKTLQP